MQTKPLVCTGQCKRHKKLKKKKKNAMYNIEIEFFPKKKKCTHSTN